MTRLPFCKPESVLRAAALSVWGTDIMSDTVSNVAKEFWPDVHRKLHKKRAG